MYTLVCVSVHARTVRADALRELKSPPTDRAPLTAIQGLSLSPHHTHIETDDVEETPLPRPTLHRGSVDRPSRSSKIEVKLRKPLDISLLCVGGRGRVAIQSEYVRTHAYEMKNTSRFSTDEKSHVFTYSDILSPF